MFAVMLPTCDFPRPAWKVELSYLKHTTFSAALSAQIEYVSIFLLFFSFFPIFSFSRPKSSFTFYFENRQKMSTGPVFILNRNIDFHNYILPSSFYNHCLIGKLKNIFLKGNGCNWRGAYAFQIKIFSFLIYILKNLW